MLVNNGYQRAETLRITKILDGISSYVDYDLKSNFTHGITYASISLEELMALSSTNYMARATAFSVHILEDTFLYPGLNTIDASGAEVWNDSACPIN